MSGHDHTDESGAERGQGDGHGQGQGHGHGHEQSEAEAAEMFEPSSWEERYAGEEKIWSGDPNPQLVAEVAGLTPGTALDVGCGEGGDVIWLARQGWRVTGADFSANGLARAAGHAADAGVGDRTDWWQIDARTFAAEGRSYDLVTTHFLHPPDGGMVEQRPRSVTRDGVRVDIDDSTLLARRTT